jgi:hypothetical protein
MTAETAVLLEMYATRGSHWLTAYEVQRLVHERTGTLYSESTITARIRDLRKPKCGRWEVLSRKREGARSWEYQLSDGD